MMTNGLLPIGSVVLLRNSNKRLMIIGVCQQEQGEDKTVLWDYAGCVYPEGYIGPTKTFLFNGEQIEQIYALGYQDQEQFAFKVKADATLEHLRSNDAAR